VGAHFPVNKSHGREYYLEKLTRKTTMVGRRQLNIKKKNKNSTRQIMMLIRTSNTKQFIGEKATETHWARLIISALLDASNEQMLCITPMQRM
jgi:hypothetical protein